MEFAVKVCSSDTNGNKMCPSTNHLVAKTNFNVGSTEKGKKYETIRSKQNSVQQGVELLPAHYMVIHKSVKHFKNSQQINYSTHHGSSYADRERNSPFLHNSQTLIMSTFGNTADIYAIVHLVPHACQHIKSDQSHSSGDMLRISGD